MASSQESSCPLPFGGWGSFLQRSLPTGSRQKGGATREPTAMLLRQVLRLDFSYRVASEQTHVPTSRPCAPPHQQVAAPAQGSHRIPALSFLGRQVHLSPPRWGPLQRASAAPPLGWRFFHILYMGPFQFGWGWDGG